MEQLSRVQLYRKLIQKNISKSFETVMRVNITVLSGVEELFLTSEQGKQIEEPDFSYLSWKIRNNVNEIDNKDLDSYDYFVEKLRVDILSIVDNFENNKKNISKKSRKLFNRLIKELAIYNDKMIEQDMEIEQRERKLWMPQVFLSHAYDDKAYSLALFDYLYEQGIYLYVGWMHDEIKKDGRIVKKILQSRIEESDQLLFLRTLNSELDIQGKQMLRPWCAWELGNFYRKEYGEEKYLINLYSVDCYSNILIHGLKLFAGVEDNRLQGVEITP